MPYGHIVDNKTWKPNDFRLQADWVVSTGMKTNYTLEHSCQSRWVTVYHIVNEQ